MPRRIFQDIFVDFGKAKRDTRELRCHVQLGFSEYVALGFPVLGWLKPEPSLELLAFRA